MTGESMETRVALLEERYQQLTQRLTDGLERISSELQWLRNILICGVLLVVAGGVLDKVLA